MCLKILSGFCGIVINILEILLYPCFGHYISFLECVLEKFTGVQGYWVGEEDYSTQVSHSSRLL